MSEVNELDPFPSLRMYTDLFLSQNEIKCPTHHKIMRGKVTVVRTGYRQYVRAVMAVGVCPEKDCKNGVK